MSKSLKSGMNQGCATESQGLQRSQRSYSGEQNRLGSNCRPCPPEGCPSGINGPQKPTKIPKPPRQKKLSKAGPSGMTPSQLNAHYQPRGRSSSETRQDNNGQHEELQQRMREQQFAPPASSRNMETGHLRRPQPARGYLNEDTIPSTGLQSVAMKAKDLPSKRGLRKFGQPAFSSPEDLRSRIQQYVDNKRNPINPIPHLTPYSGPDQDVISGQICAAIGGGCTGPLPELEDECNHCVNLNKRLDLCDDEQWLEHERAMCKIEMEEKAEENRRVQEEVECFRAILPQDLTCEEQIDYMQCMGATENAIEAVKQQQTEEECNQSSCFPSPEDICDYDYQLMEEECSRCPDPMQLEEGAGGAYIQTGNLVPGLDRPTQIYPTNQPGPLDEGPIETLPFEQRVRRDIEEGQRASRIHRNPSARKKQLYNRALHSGPPHPRRGRRTPVSPIMEESYSPTSPEEQPCRPCSSAVNENYEDTVDDDEAALQQMLMDARQQVEAYPPPNQCPPETHDLEYQDALVDDMLQEARDLVNRRSNSPLTPTTTYECALAPAGDRSYPAFSETEYAKCLEEMAAQAKEDKDDAGEAAGGDFKDEETEENDEDDPYQHRMFGPPPPPKERTTAETLKMYRQHLRNIRRRYFGAGVKYIEDVDEITPEIAAAMVLTEAQGLRMTAAPARLYEYLYPEKPSQPLVHVAPITDAKNCPPGIEDICVPLAPPMMMNAADYPGLEDPAMLDSPRVIQVLPSMNLTEDPEPCEDYKTPQDIVEVITGSVGQSAMFVQEEDEQEDNTLGEAFSFNVHLQTSLPPHYSRCQMRGSQAPGWFPGYYTALPSREGVIVNETMGTILEKVWQEVQPENVKPGGGATIIGV